MPNGPKKKPSEIGFEDLSPDKILAAVETTGVRCTGRCLQLNSMENRVFEVEVEVPDEHVLKSPYERFRVVKFYRPGRWSREQIAEEHQFIAELAAEGIPVVPPLPGGPEHSTLGRLPGDPLWFAVFPKVGGRTSYELSDAEVSRMGRAMAQLHGVGARTPAQHRVELTPATYGRQNLDYLLSHSFLPLDLATRYRQAAEAVIERSTPLFAETAMQRIHGDCHLGNVLWANEGPFWVDFDDMVTGPCVQDIWLMVPNRDEEGLRQREVFLSAYESILRFDRKSLRLIEPLRALRYIHYSAWIARRWHDPYFPRAFPHFNSWQYWSEQVRDLEEQLTLFV